MKKILIAIDYNPSSQKVAETGYELARSMNAAVVLVHVISDTVYFAIPYSPIMGYESFITNNTALLAEDLKKEAEKFLTSSAKHLGGNNITTQILEGNAADAILEYAEKEMIDLLVLGSHSHSGIYKLLIGDVTEKVLKHTNIPLMIIPNKTTSGEPENPEKIV